MLKVGKPLEQMDPSLDLVWISLDLLSHIDLKPEPLKEILPQWLQAPLQDVLKSAMI